MFCGEYFRIPVMTVSGAFEKPGYVKAKDNNLFM